MGEKRTREDALSLLQARRQELIEAGETRYPARGDFTAEQVMMIKAFLGPWPRALEAAGIKPPRADDFAQKRLEKRIAQKRRRTALKLEKRAQEKQEKSPESIRDTALWRVSIKTKEKRE